ncbi:DsbA family protein [Roseovarius nanhaiticus]|uniref:Protein-disulfide isomerase n=1 Tax=Roseovarius nanhaiticus TaxID=573024 RepID=A0A1N7ESU0_9RHOB|nr:DsbA family protein [Roseovarius nanhaiticus]SEK67340.1 Protein-disulfide isomerase [Roseovarius nanhaiticus]SIR91161.1 Protein-disulfide isomerase [Roseovarius nanhaiticus]
MNRKILIGAAILAIVGGALWWQLGGREEVAVTETADSTAAVDVDTSSITEMTMGPEDAKVTITEYASFTCPHCATFHQTTFQNLKRDYIDTGKVHFIYRDVYFDRVGLWASMLARCGGSERFFGISGMLYEQQKDWLNSDDPVEISGNLRRIGKVAGLEEEQINACLEDAGKAETLLAWFEQNAEADDISSTPTLMINGQQYGNMAYADLQEIIEEKLAE